MTTAPDSVTYIARRASPTARNAPDSAMASEKARLAGAAISRKSAATAAGSPRACSSSPNAGSRNQTSAIDRTRATTPVIARPEAASWRARARLPAPSARDTVAEIEIVRPIDTDSMMNCSWLA